MTSLILCEWSLTGCRTERLALPELRMDVALELGIGHSCAQLHNLAPPTPTWGTRPTIRFPFDTSFIPLAKGGASAAVTRSLLAPRGSLLDPAPQTSQFVLRDLCGENVSPTTRVYQRPAWDTLSQMEGRVSSPFQEWTPNGR